MIADRRLVEQYVRKTSAMENVEASLRRHLPADCQASHGLSVPYRGHEIYLEHVVTGPAGLFLIETLEDGNPWRKDLALNIAFLAGALGPYAHLLKTLVIAAQPVRDPLPPGVLTTASIDEAVGLITRREGEQLTPALARHLWSRLTPVPVHPQCRADEPDPLTDRDAARLSWFSVFLIVNAALLTALSIHPHPWQVFLFWCVLFAPATAVSAMLRHIRRREVRLRRLRIWNAVLLGTCAALFAFWVWI